MHGRFWQKAYAGIHHFKEPLPLNSQKHAESVVIDPHTHTQTHKPNENTYTDVLKALEGRSYTFPPKPFHHVPQNSMAKHPAGHTFDYDISLFFSF